MVFFLLNVCIDTASSQLGLINLIILTLSVTKCTLEIVMGNSVGFSKNGFNCTMYSMIVSYCERKARGGDSLIPGAFWDHI